MKFELLKQSIKEKVEPVYLIEGEETFFRMRASEMIKAACLSEPGLNYTRLTGADIKSAGFDSLIMSLRSYPFMSEKRVVEIADWYPTAAELKDKTLKEYFSDPTDTSVLIVLNEKPADQLKKMPSVTLVECARADEQLITRYIRSKTNKFSLIVSSAVCSKIIDYCQSDLVKIDGEVDKLIDYCKGKSEIDEKAVDLLVTKDAEYQIYEIVNFIAKKDYTNAYKIISEMRTPSEKQMLIVSLYNHFRRLFYCATTKGDNATVAQMLGVKEYAVKKAREQASAFSPKRLKKIMDKLAAGDAAFKSGLKPVDNVFSECVFYILTDG